MKDKVLKTMQSRGMLPFGSVLVGLSGGADSAALLYLLCRLSEELGFAVYAAHVNHGLRGAAADADERFSEALCKLLGVEFRVLRADVKGEAEKRGMSEELAGRCVRYEFFDKLASEHNIDRIATAHHKNDNAETILMNFVRGTGIKGLCGIPYTRGKIIRPLLDCTRAEIERYCGENSIEYVTDMTNLDTVYTRNKARHILIPEIEREFNPAFVDTITHNAQLLMLEEDYMRAETEKAYAGTVSDGAAERLYFDGVFVAIGLAPDTAFAKEHTKLDGFGYIISGEDCLTDEKGLFVAGDCRTKKTRQVATAISDGAIAALAAVAFVEGR